MELEWEWDNLIYFRTHTRRPCFLIVGQRVDFLDHKWAMPKWETSHSTFQVLNHYSMRRHCLDSRNGRRIRPNAAAGLFFSQMSFSPNVRNCNCKILPIREYEMPTYRFELSYTAGMQLPKGMHWIRYGKLSAMPITLCSPNVFRWQRGWYA